MIFSVPGWVSHRSYRTDDECKVAISNEKSREFLTLEDISAVLWTEISSSFGKEISTICSENGFPFDDVMEFIDELVMLGLLVSSTDAENTSIANELDIPLVSEEATDDVIDTESKIQQWATSKGFLWTATWEMTYRCNEECLHCYNPGASRNHTGRSRRGTQELKVSEWKVMLSELRDIGVFRLTLTGGESLLRTDIFEILENAKSLGFSISLLTNGIVINEDMANRLAQLWLHRVELSVYSLDPEKHDAITGINNSHKLTMRAAQLLIDKKVPVMLKMVLTKNTLKDIDGFHKLASALGCDSVVDGTLSIGNDGSPDTYNKLAPSAIELIKSAMDPDNPLWCGTVELPRNIGTYNRSSDSPCFAGHAVMSISPEGNIYPCLAMPMYVGSQRVDGIKSVWQTSKKKTDSPLSKWKKVTVSDFGYCGKHARCIWCQKCAGLSFLETGDETAPSSIKCRNAAARMIAHRHVSDGGTVETMDEHALSTYQEVYREELSLWRDLNTTVNHIDLNEVKAILKERTKQRIFKDYSSE